ncbi:MAG: ABC transporter ATP-binding protein [Thermofilaceae archaeon]
MIELKNLRVSYDRREVVKGVSTVFNNKHVVLGPNGHGKTTLFKAIAGLAPYKGEVIIEGTSLAKLKEGIGLLAINLPEVYRLVPLSAWETAKLYSDIMDVDLALVEQMLSELGISRKDLEKKKLWELSAGTLKAYCTALSVASGARNVLLDEPFEQLDPARKGRLAQMLERYSGTLVLNTHETWILNRFPDWYVHVMVDGRLYGPAPAGRLASAKITTSSVEHAFLRVPIGDATVSFVETGAGEPVSSLLTLDRLYDIVLKGG